MPVVVIAPNDVLLEKLKSNLQEVRARGGELFVFADQDGHFSESRRRARHPHAAPRRRARPIVYAIPLQLLSYHAARAQGHRRRQAAQPGQVGDGGIISRLTTLWGRQPSGWRPARLAGLPVLCQRGHHKHAAVSAAFSSNRQTPTREACPCCPCLSCNVRCAVAADARCYARSTSINHLGCMASKS